MKYPSLNMKKNILTLDGEVWRDVFGYEGSYQVSNFGRVRTKTRKVERRSVIGTNQLTKRGLVRIIHNDSKGYPTVVLSKCGSRVVKRVHRLVADTFLETPSAKLVEACKHHGKVFVNHKDGDKCNACVSNLEWCNQTYNCYQAVSDTATKKFSGRNHPQNKLAENEVVEIVKLYSSGLYTQQALAERYGVKQITVSNILTGYSWSLVTGIPKRARKFKHRRQPLVESTIS